MRHTALSGDLCALRSEADQRYGWSRRYDDLQPQRFDLDRHLTGRPMVYASDTVVTDVTARAKLLDLSLEADRYSAGELARCYLSRTLELHGAKRIGWHRPAVELARNIKPPVHWAGGTRRENVGRWAVVDLDGAYWQIAAAATADMSVRLVPGGGVRVGYGRMEWPRAEEVAELDKAARLAVTGYLHREVVQFWRYGRLVTAPASPKLKGPDCIAYIMLTLQSVASEAVEQWGARMVLTDSYTVPDDRAEAFVSWLEDRWNLRGTVRARGHGALYNLAWYELRATGPEDIPKSTGWVDNFRRLHTRGEPPFQPQSSSNLAGYPRVTRDALARARGWLLSRRRTDPGWS